MIIGFMMFIVAISIRNKKVFEERNLAHAKINSLQRIKNKELELEVERRTNEIREINLDLAEKNKSLDARNEEIETLLHEVHHRVKNNFQLVESLLDIQGRQTNVDQVNLLEKSKNRIRSMALVHEQLYSNTGSEVNFKDYLIDLTDGISRSMAPEQPLIEVEMEDVILSLEKSIPLGLIVNELIMNAYRHAQLGESDLIRITLNRQGDKYHLKVCLLYTSPSPRDRSLSRMPSSA